jgi:hypothetical protein
MPASAYAIMSVTAVKMIIEPTAVSNADHTNSSSPLVTRVAKVVDFIDTLTVAARDVRMPVNVLSELKRVSSEMPTVAFRQLDRVQRGREPEREGLTHLPRSVAHFFVRSSI